MKQFIDRLIEWAPIRYVFVIAIIFYVYFFYKLPNNTLEWIYRKRTGAKHPDMPLEKIGIYALGPWKKYVREVLSGRVYGQTR